jgi:hypothetical protein
MSEQVVLTLTFELPVSPADIQERCEALAEHMAALETDSEAEQAAATGGGVAAADDDHAKGGQR